MDEIQALDLRRLRLRRDQLMQRLAEVNLKIDELIDDYAQQQPVNVAPPDWGTLVSYLRELHADAGKPSARKVAARSGGMVSHTTVAKVLRGATAPSWKTLWVIGKELGADEATLRKIWLSCQANPTVPEVAPPTSLLAGSILLVSYAASQES